MPWIPSTQDTEAGGSLSLSSQAQLAILVSEEKRRGFLKVW